MWPITRLILISYRLIDASLVLRLIVTKVSKIVLLEIFNEPSNVEDKPLKAEN